MPHRAIRVGAGLTAVLVVLALVARPALAQEPEGGAAAEPGGCVGVMPASMTGVQGDAVAAGGAVRELFVSMLAGPSLQAVSLTAQLRVHALEEAKAKGCTHLVSAAVARKSRGGNSVGRLLGRAAGTAAWYIPGGSGAATVARGVSAGAAQAVSDVAYSTREKDELRLRWTVDPLRGGKAVTGEDMLKASADGEDLITPLVQRAAENIVQKVR